ncbi:MAG: glycosyltransferase, partial [candidate division WOR-3 bacterium]
MTASGLTLTAIVPVREGGEKFRQCLAALGSSRPRPDEIIVVSDGDEDGAGKLAELMGARVIYTPSPPQGPAKARNVGAAEAKGDILFFVDADVRIHVDSTRIVLTSFQEDKKIAAVIGSYDDTPSETDFFSQYKNLFHHYTHQKSQNEAFTFWGACGAIRKEVFLSVGGFDERFTRPCIEDIELGYRLKKKVHLIRRIKGLQVTHLKRWRLGNLLRTDIFYRAIPWTLLMLREGSIQPDLNLRISDRFSCAAVLGLVLTMPLVVVTGWAWIGIPLFLGLLLMLNKDWYLYLMGLRGGRFALKGMLFHWLYYFYSGLAFTTGWMIYRLEKARGERSRWFLG